MAGAAAPPRLGARLTTLLDLVACLDRLGGEARARADRLLDVRLVSGRTEPPASLEPWLTTRFGSVDAVREQTMIKVTNLATVEATLFARLRARRPVDAPEHVSDLAAEIAATENDPFCTPDTGTPADSFGRVRGARVTTGANAAMADAHHAVLVFDAHDPLVFDADLVADLFATGRTWAERARAVDARAANYMLIWNCLWRAGGSIIHGHAQALLGAGPHYARVERFRRDALAYRETHGADLVGDLVALHRDLGLALDATDGVTVLANVTPIKERELLVVGPIGMDERDRAFTDAVARTLLAYRDRIGVRCFNLGLWRAPLDGRWPDFAPIVRLVDRGDPFTRPSDIGGMELYGTPIVGADPNEVIADLRSARMGIGYHPAVFELRRDPVTGWWSAIVADRAFERAAFEVQAQPVEGSHCRHCDESPDDAPPHLVRRVALRSHAFHRIDSSKASAAQLSLSEVERATGSWEILVGPRDHHERMADASPQLAGALLRSARDAMRAIAQQPRDTTEDGRPESLYIQVVQSHGMQAGSRSSHLNVELYAIPQVPHWVAEEIGGGARQVIKTRRCVWCALSEAEEENGERLVLADHHAVVFTPAASRSAFEMMVVPRQHAADFTQLDDDAITDATATLQRALHALDALGDPPYNLFLHTAPAGERLDQTFHWHWEIHPRLRVIAGLERATALAVNPAAPEYAAQVLRERLRR